MLEIPSDGQKITLDNRQPIVPDTPIAPFIIIEPMNHTVATRTVTYDFARLKEGANEVKHSEFADAIITNM